MPRPQRTIARLMEVNDTLGALLDRYYKEGVLDLMRYRALKDEARRAARLMTRLDLQMQAARNLLDFGHVARDVRAGLYAIEGTAGDDLDPLTAA